MSASPCQVSELVETLSTKVMFSYVMLEQRVPLTYPLRVVRKLVDEVLTGMAESFGGLYSRVGRPSVVPERLLRALLLQVFYSVRSKRMLMAARL